MNVKDLTLLRTRLNSECTDILNTKGMSYSGKEDRLANFKRIAERLGVTPLVVWSVYFMKHVDSILQYVKDGTKSPEGVAGNFKDARNYIDLGYGLLAEISADEDEAVLAGLEPVACANCGHNDSHTMEIPTGSDEKVRMCAHTRCGCSEDSRE